MRRSSLMFAAAVMLPAFASSASAGTPLPSRKAGFWVGSMVMHMTMAGQPPDTDSTPMVTAMCTDPATDLKILTRTPYAQCTPPDISGGGGTYTMISSCKDPMGGATPMVTTSQFTFISGDELQVTSKTTSAHMTGDETADSKWQGACPAGWVPGDVGRMENGTMTKFGNVLTLSKPPGG